MGQGGNFNLVNATPYNWTRGLFESYQMNSWEFPQVIAPGQAYSAYVEYEEGIFKNAGDDYGLVTYDFEGVPDVRIYARMEWTSRRQIRMEFTKAAGNTQKTDIAFKHDAAVDFIAVGQAGNFLGNEAPSNWMHSTLGIIGDRKLSDVSIAGSHDSGMSVDNGGTFFARDGNTKTQQYDIKGQLERGIRWFDIRPVITSGNWACGHYTYVDAISVWQGRNGQYINEIIDQVNAFLSTNQELVILDISHGYQTDDGYRDLSDSDWKLFMDTMTKLKNLFITNSQHLAELKINDYIGSQASVLVVFRDYNPPADYMKKGFYPNSALTQAGGYANSDDIGTVENDQVDKMKSWRSRWGGYDFFQLSWTSTLQGASNAAGGDIRDNADILYNALSEKIVPASTKTQLANCILLDYIMDTQVAVTAMAINFLWGTVMK